MIPDNFTLDRQDTALLIIDIQERLAVAMDKEVLGLVTGNNRLLIELAKTTGIPVILTEQYPKGLGTTVKEVRDALADYQPIEKISFGCCGEPEFMKAIKALGRKKVIVTGMETHICVLQTVVGLIREGYVPHLAMDAVCSRTKANWRLGTEYMRNAGAVVTSTETAIFQVLGCAGTDEFKKMSKLVK